MNLKIIINISLIILFSINIINNVESQELESTSLQEKKQNLINKRIKDLKNNKPTERPNLKSLVPENLEELRYEEENGRLHKIEDQSYVNLEKKEVYLDYEHQIDRFKNEFVDQTLDVALPNYLYEQAISNPTLYKELMEANSELLNNEPRYIVNSAFFQYIKPKELEMAAYDITNKKANSFEFFYFEDGVNLNKTFFDSCDTIVCLNTENGIRIRFSCSDKECRGTVSHKNRDYFMIDEKGRLFIYNELDKDGNQIPFIHGFIDED